jgi:hypothetical protein
VTISKPAPGATNWSTATDAAIDWINANETVSTRVGALESSVGSSNLTETIHDVVAALVTTNTPGTLSITYNDVAGTLTLSVTMDNEAIDDRVAALLTQGTGITLTYNDAAGTLTINSTAVGTAGGVLSGSYPNPAFAVDMATQAELDAVAAAAAPLASPTFTGTQRLPRPVSPPVSVTFAATLTIDASTGTRFKTTATADFTLAPPTNPLDGQQLTVVILAQTTTRNLTVSGSIGLTTGLSAAVAIPAGKKWVGGLLYDGDLAAWVLVASTLYT